MSDYSVPVAGALSRPYLGLDFYCEQDAGLFIERENELDDCASMLHGMNVKILILQGSTGAGKSSFLRAGLIPRLRQGHDGQAHFLSDGDCVIRCTANPLIWIFAQLADAIKTDRFGLDAPPPEWPAPAAAAAMRPKHLADIILAALRWLCRDLSGHLVLILDQAEEVLTQGLDRHRLSDAGQAFFYFLEGIYLQRIDVRFVVALRTEYYGRFRDELRINDNHITTPLHSSIVEPYLLRALRDPAALVRIILEPTKIMDGPAPRFHFTFEFGAATRIVVDLLDYFPHGSVTPFLQVICATLFEHLDDHHRTITLRDYKRLGDIRGIAFLYLDRGVKQGIGAGAKAAERNAWLLLLHGLTSSQGGGTVLSNIQSLDALQEAANTLKINEDIRIPLQRMCEGKAPLLRGLPTEHPTQFSLKHDVLALVFTRWKVEHNTRLMEQDYRKRKNARMIGSVILGAIAVTVGLAFFFYKKAESDALTTPLIGRLRAAINPPRSEYGESLEIIVDSINAINKAPLLLPLDRANLKADAVKQLKSVIVRSPIFHGEYIAANFDASASTITVLNKGITQSRLPVVQRISMPELSIHPGRASQNVMQPDADVAEKIDRRDIAVGSIDGLGTTAVIDNVVLFPTKDSANPGKIDLEKALTSNAGPTQYVRREIKAGKLYVITYLPVGDKLILHGTALTGNAIRSAPTSVQWEKLSPSDPFRPPAFYSDASLTQGAFAYYSGPESEGLGRYAWHIHAPGKSSIVLPAPGNTDPLAEQNMRLAFVTGANAVLLQREAATFEYLALANDNVRSTVPQQLPETAAPFPLLFAANSGPRDAAHRPLPSYTPWAPSPIAAVQQGGRLTVAWMTGGGVALAAGNIGEAMRNPLPGNGVLLAGEPNGSKLQFSEDGKYLFLQQQPYPSRPLNVRVWDVTRARADAIASMTEAKLIDMACTIIQGTRDGQSDLREAHAVRPSPLRGSSAACPEHLSAKPGMPR